jgi:sigma-70-like protein
LRWASRGSRHFATDNQQVAEDLVSEVFLDIWRHAAKFQARSQGFDLDSGDSTVQGAGYALVALQVRIDPIM